MDEIRSYKPISSHAVSLKQNPPNLNIADEPLSNFNIPSYSTHQNTFSSFCLICISYSSSSRTNVFSYAEN